MAGSQDNPFSVPSCPACHDTIIAARLEGIKQLAGGLSDRVAVLDRDFNVIYANESAWSGQASRWVGRQAKCFEVFAQRNDPCEVCPAGRMYESPDVPSLACSIGADGTVCGMHRAIPLVASSGEVDSVLALFNVSNPVKQSVRERLEEKDESKLGELIGSSASMREVLDMVRLVADSSATVLIQGESGTGKELVAKTIHQISYRRGKPFVVVDCGSLPEMLLESELFGHVKGAFTGAYVARRGLFEEADGGTIFLDEIADTSATFQAKLLRVLQEGEIKPVGGTRPIKIDARVISATNKDLIALVKAKTFRQDLYYRLAVLPLYLPPLRERAEDIPLLVEHFVAGSCKRHHQRMRHVSDEAMHVLREAPWPGNVRELQHYIERAVVTTAGPILACKDKDIVALDFVAKDGGLRSAIRGAVIQTERVRIVDALKKTGGNRSQAAKRLKISRASLYNKLRDYNIHEA